MLLPVWLPRVWWSLQNRFEAMQSCTYIWWSKSSLKFTDAASVYSWNRGRGDGTSPVGQDYLTRWGIHSFQPWNVASVPLKNIAHVRVFHCFWTSRAFVKSTKASWAGKLYWRALNKPKWRSKSKGKKSFMWTTARHHFTLCFACVHGVNITVQANGRMSYQKKTQ